ncbi:MAG: addiction module protein [Micrococcales bacterium]|nr:addiction module protein [Micrococcales bacterium]
MAPELLALVEKGRLLAPDDRYELAHQMLISVDGPAGDQASMDAAWEAEYRSRIDDIESGNVPLVDGQETMRIARQRIAARRTSNTA